MKDIFQERAKYELDFYRKKLCSVKQFVGNGKLVIDTETTTFNSKFVNIIITRENGKTYKLECDSAISNGIKTGQIDEDFLLYEDLDEMIFGETNNDLNLHEKKQYFCTYCCIILENEKYIIKFDIENHHCGPWDFLPIEEPDDDRFIKNNFKILCSISDYIGDNGNFYQNKTDKREFVVTRYQNDNSPVRLLCSQELEFQLSNGKNPKYLLDYYIGIYKNDDGEEFLRIFDNNHTISQPWYRLTGTYFIINQIIRNPYKYSFINVPFNQMNYIKIK
jgi:hypothetical protein